MIPACMEPLYVHSPCMGMNLETPERRVDSGRLRVTMGCDINSTVFRHGNVSTRMPRDVVGDRSLGSCKVTTRTRTRPGSSSASGSWR